MRDQLTDLMNAKGLSFPEAVELLASEHGLTEVATEVEVSTETQSFLDDWLERHADQDTDDLVTGAIYEEVRTSARRDDCAAYAATLAAQFDEWTKRMFLFEESGHNATANGCNQRP